MQDAYDDLLTQVSGSWHEGGLFMGMHWAWWIFVAATLLVLIWGFWIAFADRGTARRQEATRESAEEALRRRLARGEISEEQFAETLRVLRESR